MNRVYFHLPDFYEKAELNLLTIDLLKKYPEYFYEGVTIKSVYGCFPNSIFNGGRVVLGGATMEEIEEIIEEFNQRGVSLCYTFTNPVLKEEHLNDTFCNLCLRLANNGMNEVIVNSPRLESYIRKHYPSYRLISSTTKCITEPKGILEEEKKEYSMVVCDTDMNNTKALFALPQKERYELLVDSFCRDHCPRRIAHYEEIGKAQLEFRSSRFPSCPFIHEPFEMQKKRKHFITREMLYGEYQNAGFCHFKLDGRAFPQEKVMESYLYYMVKERYQEIVRKAMETLIHEISE